jgi:hypothetical protein
MASYGCIAIWKASGDAALKAQGAPRRVSALQARLPAPRAVLIKKGLPDYKPVSVPLTGQQSFVWAAHYWTALATYPEVERNGPLLLPYLVLLRMGFALPAGLLRPRCALTAPFHPYLPRKAAGGIFSVALSVKSALSEPPRPLAGMLPCGDRTFLPAVPGLATRSTGRLPIRQARTDCRTSSGSFFRNTSTQL